MKTSLSNRLCGSAFRFSFAAVLGGLFSAPVSQAQQTNGIQIEIVNDTGIPDSELLFQFVGQTANINTNAPLMTNTPVLPTNAFTSTDGTPGGSGAGSGFGPGMNVPLTTLATNNPVAAPYAIVSPISGNTNNVYSMYVNYVKSGTIYFQYGGQPFNAYLPTNSTVPGENPTAGYPSYSPNRFEYIEMSFLPTNATDMTTPSAADITFVNKFGMPVQLDWYDSVSTNSRNLINSSSVLVPTKDLVQRFRALKLDSAVYGFSDTPSAVTNNGTNVNYPTSFVPGWTGTNAIPDLPIGQSYTNFARILNPYSLYLSASAGVYPYPSLKYYLDSLTNSPFQLNGTAPQNHEWYAGYNVTMSTTNHPTLGDSWVINMAYSGSLPPNLDPSLYGSGNTQYTNTISWVVPYIGASYTIFQASAAASNVYVNGVLDGSLNSVEQWMLGDVQTAITAGYWGGSSSNSANWFITKPFVPPTPYPFALARSTNDGFYNLYASLLYAHTDGYGFTYGERYTPSVLIAPSKGQTLRITLLPDSRLASPVVDVTSVSTNSITMGWSAVPNATQYQINTIRPLNVPAVTVPASQTNYTVSGLTPGLPYTFSVQALATNNGNPIASSYRPVSTATSGSLPTATNAGTIPVGLSVSPLSDPFQRLGNFYFNGTTYSNFNSMASASNLSFMAAVGTNQLPLGVYDTNGQLVWYDWLTFVIGSNSPTTASVSAVQVHANSYPTPNAFLSGTNTNFTISTNAATPSFQIPFSYSPSFPFKPSAPALAGGSNNYTTWISQYYQIPPNSLPTSDPDKDGSSNLTEYLQARNPSASDAAGSQNLVFVANTNAGTLSTNLGTLRFSYRNATTPNELFSSVIWSTNMTNFSSDGLAFMSNAPGGTNFTYPTYQLAPVTNSNIQLQFEAILP